MIRLSATVVSLTHPIMECIYSAHGLHAIRSRIILALSASHHTRPLPKLSRTPGVFVRALWLILRRSPLSGVGRNRIDPSRMERVAAADALRRHPDPPRCAVLLDRVERILGACRIIPAPRWLKRRDILPVKADRGLSGFYGSLSRLAAHFNHLISWYRRRRTPRRLLSHYTEGSLYSAKSDDRRRKEKAACAAC